MVMHWLEEVRCSAVHHEAKLSRQTGVRGTRVIALAPSGSLLGELRLRACGRKLVPGGDTLLAG